MQNSRGKPHQNCDVEIGRIIWNRDEMAEYIVLGALGKVKIFKAGFFDLY